MWKLIFDCGKKHISGCFASGRTAWRVRDRSQELHLHSVTHCWKWDAIKRLWQTQMAERKTKWQKNAEPGDEVVCKLCKLQLALHSTTSNMTGHLENMHPNEHAMMSGTATKQPHLHSYFSSPAMSSLSAATRGCRKARERERGLLSSKFYSTGNYSFTYFVICW